MKICICGGGSLGHVCAGVLSSHPNVEVSVLTRRPLLWNPEIEVTDPDGKVFRSSRLVRTSDEKEAVSGAEIVLLCLPGYLIEDTLRSILPHIGEHTKVGSIVSNTGFFFQAHNILPSTTGLFGFQRTPFIARVNEYGKSAFLLGYKKEIHVVLENIDDRESFRSLIENLFLTKTSLLDSFYEVSLSNSNPLLHTSRLYSLWHNYAGQTYSKPILFYKEWNNEASELLIAMDREFMDILKQLPVKPGAIPPILQYYESTDAESLTSKISGIPAFQTIVAPMKETAQGWVPDFSSRYFTEDFPLGLKYIQETASRFNISVPTIDKVLKWGLKVVPLLAE